MFISSFLTRRSEVCNIHNTFELCISGRRLQDLHRPAPHDHGSLGAGHHWDVERHEQSVREPVASHDASVVQHVARRLHGSLLHPSLRHPLRRGSIGE